MTYLYFDPETGMLTGFGDNPNAAPSLAMPTDFSIDREFKSSRIVAGQLARASVLPPLTRRRLRLGLLSIGIRSPDIEAVIAAIPDAEAREWAMVEWKDASEYERDHPLIADAMAALDLPAEQVDTLWLWAAGL